MFDTTLREQVESLQGRLSPALVGQAVGELLRQGEDVGGGVNAIRLVRHLLDRPDASDVQAVWAYEQIKPALRAALEQIPTLYFLEGD